MSVGTTLGVLLLGVLPGVLLAVALSLIWLLSVESRPNDAVLGRVKGQKGYHNVKDYPAAKTIPGLLIYRFEANLVFYNADYMKARVKALIAAQKTPVEWLVFDASTINIVDATGLRKFDELREELAADGVSVYVARLKRYLGQFFNDDFAAERRKSGKKLLFPTLKPAINAFLKQQQTNESETVIDANPDAKAQRKKARKYLKQALRPAIDTYLKQQQVESESEEGTKPNKQQFQSLKPAIDAYLKQHQEAGLLPTDTAVVDQALDDRQWQENVELPRKKKQDIVPAPEKNEATTKSGRNRDK